ncbi:preprotein translocase subunit SecE [Pseudonocardiaceae bacterium YIM PH 21723]|nr:preprotein translocase subunit SecE [Pseudonocardiaceae bacterium YIM PH 21723]
MSEDREQRPDERDTARPTTAAGRRAERRAGARPAAAAGASAAKRSSKSARPAQGKGSPFKRLSRFVREVVAELRKVIWPTRKQLVTYTMVVLVFVVFMVSFVSLLDYGFASGVLALFG